MTDEIAGLDERQLGDLCAFADGTLPARRRPEVEAWIASSPGLLELVERQRRSLAATRALADEPVPASLSAAIAPRPKVRARRRRPLAVGLSAAAALAAVAVVFVVLSLTSGPGAPSVADAARFATSPPSSAAPALVPGTGRLAADVQGLPFPDLSSGFGWRATGARRGEVSGRPATVVYYRKDGHSMAYAIVAKPALALPQAAASTTRDGVRYQTLTLNGRTVITWRRDGHTCVMLGNASPAELLALASWRHGGTESY